VEVGRTHELLDRDGSIVPAGEDQVEVSVVGQRPFDGIPDDRAQTDPIREELDRFVG
jgi:hypothetical protein